LKVRVGLARWQQDLNVSNASAAPTAITDGIEVPGGKRNEYAHLLVEADANTVVNVSVWGLARTRWAVVETFQLVNKTNEAEALVGATAYDRIKTQITGTNHASAGLNTWLGFCDG